MWERDAGLAANEHLLYRTLEHVAVQELIWELNGELGGAQLVSLH